MSITMQNGPTQTASSLLARSFVLSYGLLAYLIFFGTFLYAVGFISQFIMPKTIDSGVAGSTAQALLIDLALMSLFAVQHSGMARQGFKKLFAAFASPALERSTYVLLASLSLILLFWQWRPITAAVWEIETPMAAYAAVAGSFAGWLIVLYSTFLISHFELFGLTQVVSHFAGRLAEPMKFRTPGLYRLIRHPIYLGFIIAFWSTPTMTLGHMLFAMVTTAYIFVGIWLEERDLITLFGDQYRHYREKVAMLIPGLF
ncbi:protein-S-isoprenylcysteine O-methyltransferase Ste14 [Bradyrhizobium sp. CIR48]|uniref:methanethiol S-methyltransferase n=1 Tax=unclassified Bradyrhizobium TaxID=2631580 RepID=UPI0017EEC569|nr:MULTISPECIES: methanethiol S-methyltransferase [unclassified Bradyrhizobium]MBB4382244.1 protein-S-isoprenylcysteine O-methyltransferase Ste14 [Bradyrhizobium sp. SBR1B]MBB4425240.1 protein-S-isoprenylcysteine O-methyltransferase Ste14 [Bradyrhizobium sp. CIR48]